MRCTLAVMCCQQIGLLWCRFSC